MNYFREVLKVSKGHKVHLIAEPTFVGVFLHSLPLNSFMVVANLKMNIWGPGELYC